MGSDGDEVRWHSIAANEQYCELKVSLAMVISAAASMLPRAPLVVFGAPLLVTKGLESALGGAVETKDPAQLKGCSSSDSARSAQLTLERRAPELMEPGTDSADEGAAGERAQGLAGEPGQELAGEPASELAGEGVKEARLRHWNTPAASSSAAFSCTHSGSIRERKGLLVPWGGDVPGGGAARTLREAASGRSPSRADLR